MNDELNPEPFVDATRAAEFLGIKPRRVLEMARAGQIPGYPLGTGARRTWRFRLTEICKAIGGSGLVTSGGIRWGREPRLKPLPKTVSIGRGMANNRIQAVSSATKETI